MMNLILTYVNEKTCGCNENKGEVAKRIKQEIEDGSNHQNKGTGSAWTVFERDFHSQVMDPMFMEPESGLAWYDATSDAEGPTLHLLLGTQSPTGDIAEVADIFTASESRFKVQNVTLISCYPGGGFGGRDKSYFTQYLALAAPYAEGKPLRWSLTRFEQFQVGLKRHETAFSEKLAFDDNGVIQAMECEFVMNGGGRKNLSPYVAQLAALSSFSCYEIPKVVAGAKATDTQDLIGGSQRGFGGPQAFIAIETLMDEAATHFKMDPFAIRRHNLLKTGGKTVTGAPILQDLRLNEILDRLKGDQLWRNRLADAREYKKQGLEYGVGLALSNEAYGTSSDGMDGAVVIQPDGTVLVRNPVCRHGQWRSHRIGAGTGDVSRAQCRPYQDGRCRLFHCTGIVKRSQECASRKTRLQNVWV